MISNIKYLFKNKSSILPQATQSTDTLDYWRARAQKFGKRAVINIDHSLGQFDEIKNRDKEILFPLLKKNLTGREELVLDFGCGSGRFTSDLSELTGSQVVGVDPTEELIQLAPLSDRVKYIVLKNKMIPLPDQSVDLIWIYAVLGCIKGPMIAATFSELHRVLKKTGKLFLTENTSDAPDSTHYTYRSLREYLKISPLFSLSHVRDYFDTGEGFKEKFSVMVGKKN